MNIDKYALKASENYVSFEFVSEGRNGRIQKKIIFTLIEEPNIWNLGFGDVDNLTGEINDLAKSDNGDSEKILATVAQATLIFTKHHPESLVLQREVHQFVQDFTELELVKILRQCQKRF